MITDKMKDRARVFLGPFLVEQGLEGKQLNQQAAKVYEAAVHALASQRIGAVDEEVRCEDLTIIKGRQVVVTFKDKTDAFALFNELKSRAALSAMGGGMGGDMANVVVGVSSSCCFCPEDDDPENFDGRMITWTFAVPKYFRTGAGFYRLEFVRTLTAEERGNTGAQIRACAAIAMEAGTAETQSGSVHDSAGLKGIAGTDAPSHTEEPSQ